MVKKNEEHLRMLNDAVSRFKKIQEQDPGDNEIFSKELGSATVNQEMFRWSQSSMTS
jgi:hypothetical protein